MNTLFYPSVVATLTLCLASSAFAAKQSDFYKNSERRMPAVHMKNTQQEHGRAQASMRPISQTHTTRNTVMTRNKNGGTITMDEVSTRGNQTRAFAEKVGYEKRPANKNSQRATNQPVAIKYDARIIQRNNTEPYKK